MTEISKVIKDRLKADGRRYWAGDNISDYIAPGEKEKLIDELNAKFDAVLDSSDLASAHSHTSWQDAYLYHDCWDRSHDRSLDYPAPDATAFPNEMEDRYEGMLVVRSELRSVCSHHHQPVTGVAYIGIIAADRLIGLSKYTRIAQWCSRRGTLQEELCNDIAKEIMKATGSADVGVYIQATHGCCENRGIMAHSSLTQTTVLKGSFFNDPGTKKEFFDNIKLQQEYASR